MRKWPYHHPLPPPPDLKPLVSSYALWIKLKILTLPLKSAHISSLVPSVFPTTPASSHFSNLLSSCARQGLKTSTSDSGQISLILTTWFEGHCTGGSSLKPFFTHSNSTPSSMGLWLPWHCLLSTYCNNKYKNICIIICKPYSLMGCKLCQARDVFLFTTIFHPLAQYLTQNQDNG